MKIITKQLICIILLLNSITILGQTIDLETETAFMNCIYEVLPDKGEKMRSLFNKAEKKLIEKKLLKDGKGESYIALYKNLENAFDQELGDLGLFSYTNEIAVYMKTEQMTKCMETVFSDKKYEDSKLSQFITLISMLDQVEKGKEEIIDKILTILDAKDFENDYYKFTTFTMIEAMNMTTHNSSEHLKNVKETLIEEKMEQALNIVVYSRDNIVVNNEKIVFKELRMKIVNYFKKNKSESSFLVSTKNLIEDSLFTDVHNEIVAGANMIRNHMAKKKYKLSFRELSEKQQQEFINIYPIKIKDIITNE